MMRLAMIGAGSIGMRHINNLMASCFLYDNSLHVYDVDESRLGAVHPIISRHCQKFTIEEAMKYDAVMICTPASSHAELIRCAIRTERPFFVEKPAVLSLDSLEHHEWHTSVPHVVGYNWRWHDSYRCVPTLAMNDGSVSLYCDTDMSKWPSLTYSDAVFECSHEIDLALYWFGAATCEHEGLRGEAAFNITLHHDCEVTSSVHVRTNQDTKRFARVADMDIHADVHGAVMDRSYMHELEHTLNVFRGRTASLSTLRQAYNVTQICERRYGR